MSNQLFVFFCIQIPEQGQNAREKAKIHLIKLIKFVES